MRRAPIIVLLAALALAAAPSALAAHRSWAAAEIAAVTRVGVLGRSAATFRPRSPLTQGQLAQAISATNAIQHPPQAQPTQPAAVELTSTIGAGATIGGLVSWTVDAPGRQVAQVAFAVDGIGRTASTTAPFAFDLGAGGLDTTALADGPHQLAVNVSFAGGGSAIAVWSVTVDNADGAGGSFGAGGPIDVPVAKSTVPPLPAAAPAPVAQGVLFHAYAPGAAVTIRQLDAVLVSYLHLGGAAREIQQTLSRAGLHPRPNTGSEAVARMLGLRLDHPASQDELELLPGQAATRAEAAWSFARVLRLGAWSLQAVQQAADGFALPAYSLWQRRILATAISYVGYPYVWGGTSPTHEVDFGVPAVGGFDCSGLVWRVYKLTRYAGARDLAGVLRGRTTYVMSGEVPHSKRIAFGKLQPGDVMFFGAKGRRSTPSIVDHTAIYLGGGWFVQSSGQGVTLLPLDDWYRTHFAWARRPLREAGLAG